MTNRKSHDAGKPVIYVIAVCGCIVSFASWSAIFVSKFAEEKMDEMVEATEEQTASVTDLADVEVHSAADSITVRPPIIQKPLEDLPKETKKIIRIPLKEAPKNADAVDSLPEVSSSFLVPNNSSRASRVRGFASLLEPKWELRRSYELSIPDIDVDVPVLLPSKKYWATQQWDLLEEQMQQGLNHGAVAYPHSVQPGRRGNIIIAGHSSPPSDSSKSSGFGHLFASLPQLQKGSEIHIRNGRDTVTYKVTGQKVVDPTDTSILEQKSDNSILTLMTCYPVGTTEDRWVVIAKRQETA